MNDYKLWQVPKYELHELKSKSSDYCVCIPVVNEGKRLKNEIDRIKNIKEKFDVVILDAGSTDGSTDIKYLIENGIRSLLIKKDSGKLSAQLRMGYAYAIEQGYKGIITVDGNNKDSVESIPDFIKELKNGYDFVQGSRYVLGGKAVNTPLIRTLAIKLIHAPIISLISGYRYTDTTNGFRGYSTRFLLDDRVKPFRNIFNTYELIAYLSVKAPQLGYKVKEIPVERKYPKSSKIPTKISPVKGNLELLKILFSLMLKRYDYKG